MRIGLYPGSFNPLHKGHINIIEKALRIFDKVILNVGVNADKGDKPQPVITLPNHPQVQISYWDGYTTDYVKALQKANPENTVTIIRGVRNSSDYAYEMNNLAFMRELMPEAEIILIPCDREFEHLSSSSLRKLSIFGDEFAHHIVAPK
jgi:pantetheine-phosphate adenylyltransferase